MDNIDEKKVLVITLATLMCMSILVGCSGSSTGSATGGSTSVSTDDSQIAGVAEYSMISGTANPDTHPYTLELLMGRKILYLLSKQINLMKFKPILL